MTLKTVPITDNANVPLRLRQLADRIEESGVINTRVTCIVGNDVYCWGPVSDDRAAEGAVFDMTYGIHKLMGLPVRLSLEEDGH